MLLVTSPLDTDFRHTYYYDIIRHVMYIAVSRDVRCDEEISEGLVKEFVYQSSWHVDARYITWRIFSYETF